MNFIRLDNAAYQYDYQTWSFQYPIVRRQVVIPQAVMGAIRKHGRTYRPDGGH